MRDRGRPRPSSRSPSSLGGAGRARRSGEEAARRNVAPRARARRSVVRRRTPAITTSITAAASSAHRQRPSPAWRRFVQRLGHVDRDHEVAGRAGGRQRRRRGGARWRRRRRGGRGEVQVRRERRDRSTRRVARGDLARVRERERERGVEIELRGAPRGPGRSSSSSSWIACSAARRRVPECAGVSVARRVRIRAPVSSTTRAATAAVRRDLRPRARTQLGGHLRGTREPQRRIERERTHRDVREPRER